MTEFRLYKESDYTELRDMIFSLYREDPEGQPADEEKIKRTIAESKDYPEKVSLYLFVNGGDLVGYAILVFFWSNEYGGNIITIDELYVKEGYRNQGIGTKFISYVEKKDNKAAVQLETTPSNSRANEYYRRLGFVASENVHLIKPVQPPDLNCHFNGLPV